MKIESLKEQARQHEQREEWGKAMQLYSRALERASEEDDLDIALHNRIGDLQVRIGDIEGAIASYETAIDLYLEADLANNAMAVCRKLERNAPNRSEILLRMGQIRVRQGFVVDARQDFLGYAESQIAAGDMEEALRALEEFASLAPSDVETRLFLAEQLHRSDRTEDAVRHFHDGYRILQGAGRQEEADQVRGRVAEIAPEVDLDDVASADEDGAGDGRGADASGELAGFETTSLSGIELEGPTAEPDASEDAGVEPEAAGPEPPVPEEVETASEAESADGPVLDEGDDEGDGLAALEGAVFDLDDEPFEEDEPPEGDAPLPTLDDDADVQPHAREATGEDDEEDWGGPTDLPFLEDPVAAPAHPRPQAVSPFASPEEAHEDADERALLEGDRDLLVETEEDSLDELRARTLGDPTDGDTWRRLGVALLARGEDEEARDALEAAHRAYDVADDPERAMRVVRELIFHEPDQVAHYQRLVEYAHRTGDRALLVPAFLELAEALARAGAAVKARTVYAQVLALAPRNPRALAALADSDEMAGDLVDFGGMVLDEPQRDSFRWKVSGADPSGDEEADFARMLSQFKEKVARDLPSDDATAHYDLGAAYKEMGLFDEAVAQFQQALRAHPNHLAAYEMVGQCFLEKGQPEAAVRSLQRALDMDWGVEDELLGIYYFLGQAHEAVGNRESAVEFYERVFSLDINFKDVTERLRALR